MSDTYRDALEAVLAAIRPADNGVTKEGISSAPVSVTMAQAVNMTLHKTGMSCLAKAFGCEVQVVDVGIATPYRCEGILDRCIRKGTGNLAVFCLGAAGMLLPCGRLHLLHLLTYVSHWESICRIQSCTSVS